MIRANQNLTRHVGCQYGAAQPPFWGRGIEVEDVPKYGKVVIYQNL